MNEDSLRNEWRQIAPLWIQEMREGRNANRKGLLDGSMLEACGNVEGLNVLDCGCGEGRFCRELVAHGAGQVLGIDLCAPMIVAARQQQSRKEHYQIADAQDLSFAEDGIFDLVISYLNQCDLPDFRANNREVFRVLKPEGQFVIANLHPMRSAVGGWHRTDDDEKQHAILDRYFDETERHWNWKGAQFTNFHRSLMTYVNGFLDAGFLMEKLIEPSVAVDQLQRFPELEDELRVPNFIIYLLRKRVAP